MTFLLLVNPTSGGGKGRRVGEKVESLLQNRAIPYRNISGSSFESAQSSLRASLNSSILNSSIQGVIAVGGDGLVHLAIQELAHSKVPLMCVPAGTGNDFARAMNIPLNDVDAIFEKILHHEPQYIDLGKVGTEYFAAILSTGFDSAVNERANRISWIQGQMKYNISILLELPVFQPLHYTFTVDGKSFDSPAMLIAVANNSSYGGGMLVCPDADPTDGLFDIMILKPISKYQFLRVFPKVFKGEHVTHPAVDIIRGKKIEIHSTSIAYSDGERIGPLPIEAMVSERALRTWVFE